MPHLLIKYAHVLICISAGKGSRHFSAFYFTIDRSYGELWKIIRRFPSTCSFQMGTVCFHAQIVPPFLSCVHFRVLQCSVLCRLALVLWTSIIYGLLRGCYNRKPVIYGCLASIFAIGRISLEGSAKSSPATVTKLIARYTCIFV